MGCSSHRTRPIPADPEDAHELATVSQLDLDVVVLVVVDQSHAGVGLLHHGPDGTVGVLPSVLSYAWHIPFDVARENRTVNGTSSAVVRTLSCV
jgi:hypothetical protein